MAFSFLLLWLTMKPTHVFTLLGASMLVATTSAYSFELTHNDGTLSLPKPLEAIVSFDLGVLDTLSALDIPVAGVPKSTYEGAWAKYQQLPVIGTLFEPDYEVLKQLKPDLIVGSGRAAKATPELQRIAPVAMLTPDPNQFLVSFRQVNTALGKAFGKEAQAQQYLAGIDQTIQKLHEVNKGKKGAFLFTVRGNVIPHVPGDRFGYAFELAGLDSVLPARDPKAPVAPRPEPGSPEAKAAAQERERVVQTIAQAEPDWLMVLDRGAINGGEKTAANTLAEHPVLSQTKAFKEGRVYYVDPNGWYIVGTGLNNMQRITEDMLKAMQ